MRALVAMLALSACTPDFAPDEPQRWECSAYAVCDGKRMDWYYKTCASELDTRASIETWRFVCEEALFIGLCNQWACWESCHALEVVCESDGGVP